MQSITISVLVHYCNQEIDPLALCVQYAKGLDCVQVPSSLQPVGKAEAKIWLFWTQLCSHMIRDDTSNSQEQTGTYYCCSNTGLAWYCFSFGQCAILS
uniref:Uncharacterized protein n=1 Tax=Pyxicephalus adspersus TaxID=30357 RepID=A0AAV3AW66_PYXAD|nr:TPA: hypothetical protein GDO54_006987 [Pyxicephalus adspersus]